MRFKLTRATSRGDSRTISPVGADRRADVVVGLARFEKRARRQQIEQFREFVPQLFDLAGEEGVV